CVETALSASANLPGSAHLAALELRTWIGHATSVLPPEYVPRHGRAVGRVECHLWHLLRSDFSAVWPALPNLPIEDPVGVGNRCRHTAICAAAVYSLGDRRLDCSGADRIDGGCRYRCLSRPHYSLVSRGSAGDHTHDVERALFHHDAVRRY